MSRIFSVTALAAVLLAFALPFGAVSSCDGEEVHFTGVELATFRVAPDPEHAGTLHQEVERNAGMLAVAALGAAAVGIVLALLGWAGCGICASLGLVDMQVMIWAILLTSDAGGDLFVGYWLALTAFAVAALLYFVLGLRSRRQRGRTAWAYVGRTAAVLSPTLAVSAIAAASLLDA